VTVHGPGYDKLYLPGDPGPAAGRRAQERYAKDLAQHSDLLRRQKALVMEPNPGAYFLCGEKVEQEPFCHCGHTAEMLCDYPMGEGKTCDLAVCWCCSKHIAEDRDLCLVHFAVFVRESGVERINPWPPKRA
jgi:hypothetical protein